MKTSRTVAEESEAVARSRVLVDPQWLDRHLQDPKVRVVEVDVGPASYNDWHIPGAVLWNIYADLKDTQYRTVASAAIEELVARSGIGLDTTVVFYGYAPCFGFWLMTLMGHPEVRVLDCSRDTWRAAGRPCSTEVTQPAPTPVRVAAEDATVRADRPAVLAALGRPDTVLLDVRTAAEYRGERFWPSGAMDPAGRAGHVPTAVHQPIDGLYRDDGSFRSRQELAQIFAELEDTDGATGGAELITYCTVGGRAATTWFALRYLLGRDRVRVYDGSWAEWGRSPEVPVARP
ncbi:MAG TPA: sulfurtransferase [Sinomonas sp.]|nr:sulfurtransferase [Sinomonas sp.]